MKKLFKALGIALLAGTIGCSSGTTEKTAVEKFDDAVGEVKSTKRIRSYDIENSDAFKYTERTVKSSHSDTDAVVTFDEEEQAVLIGVVARDGFTRSAADPDSLAIWNLIKETFESTTTGVKKNFKNDGYDVTVGYVMYSDLDASTPILIVINGTVVYDFLEEYD